MSPSEDDPRGQTPIDLPHGQTAILSREIVGRLIDAAADLTYIDRAADGDREIAEVAAWGRMAQAHDLHRITLPDPTAARLFGILAEGIAATEEHDRILATHEALEAFKEVPD
jgi:hypothetical protein